jgi:hypothetical protein
VLTKCGRLEPSSEVFVDDAPWSSSEEKPLLLHPDISNAVGTRLGCTSVRSELALASEVADDESDSGSGRGDGADPAEQFGQQEDLSTRIRGLVGEYDGR